MEEVNMGYADDYERRQALKWANPIKVRDIPSPPDGSFEFSFYNWDGCMCPTIETGGRAFIDCFSSNGQEHYKEVLDWDCVPTTVWGDFGYEVKPPNFDIDSDEDTYEVQAQKLNELAYDMAGYCSSSDYDNWFVEG